MPIKAVRVSSLVMLGLWLFAALPMLGGCGSSTTSDRDLVLIEYAELVALQEAARPGGRRDRLVVVDVRTPDRFAEGHIPGAVNLRLPDMRRNDPRLTDAAHIVVYGSDWQDARGPAGAKQLIQFGYGQVYDFRGGLDLWRARGGAVEQDDS